MLDKSQRSFLSNPNTTSVEIAKFDQLAEEWWNPKGKYKRVMDFNMCRWGVIHKQLSKHFGNNIGVARPTALDIGSGGGLLCEPLAKLGFSGNGY